MIDESLADFIVGVWEAQESTDRVERTWNAAYPDRRPWSKIGEEAQAEWRRVFAIYDSLEP